MNAANTLYPAGPANVPDWITEPSPTFKAEVKKVMSSILLFFIVYIILILLSIALAVLCVFAGFAVISNVTHWIAIVAGIGIISIGIMVFIFLIKFIFSVKKFDESTSQEITETEHPELFNFIRQLTNDTQTKFPKKIIISPEVNACVFYNDSFWSMFFPVRKNLQIGLGLVNSLTLSEFKAVMAHEFGHFSQRSMKLGSFVYNVNKAIYNMLYENKDYAGFLEGFGRLHAVLWFFVSITVEIVKVIQKILQWMYGFINRNYMSLSREMEFHADAVAASVSGSKDLVSALRKIEVTDVCYNIVIQKANEYLEKHGIFENIYTNHDVVMQQYARENNLAMELNTPVVDDLFFKKFETRRLNIQNQWASHPSRDDRESHLNNLGIESASDKRSAWVLFSDPDRLQKEISSIVYKSVPDNLKQRLISSSDFIEQFTKDIHSGNLPGEYNGYYDGDRRIGYFDIEAVFATKYDGETSKEEFEKLVSAEKIGLLKKISANNSDAQILEAIINKQIDIKTFDYDGIKCEKTAATEILEKLKLEIQDQEKLINANDEKLVAFFHTAALKASNQDDENLKGKYIRHFENREKADKFTGTAQKVVSILSPLLQGQKVSIEAARQMASELKTEEEYMRPLLTEWSAMGMFDNNKELKEMAERFIKADYHYFHEDSFIESELGDIHRLANEVFIEISKFQFNGFKNILEYQLTFIKPEIHSNMQMSAEFS